MTLTVTHSPSPPRPAKFTYWKTVATTIFKKTRSNKFAKAIVVTWYCNRNNIKDCYIILWQGDYLEYAIE